MAATRDRQRTRRTRRTRPRNHEERGRGQLAAARRRSLTSLVEAVLDMPGESKLEVVERILVKAAMTVAGGNRSEAARILGVHRKVIERRVAQPSRAQPSPRPLAHLVAAILEMPIADKLSAVKRAVLDAASARADGNKSETARILGVHRKTVERLLAR